MGISTVGVWLKKQWAKLAAGCALLVAGVVVYFAGRSRSKGELSHAAARRELELNVARGAALEARVQENHERRVDLVAQVLAEEAALFSQKEVNNGLTPDDVVARLRAHGLVKPK